MRMAYSVTHFSKLREERDEGGMGWRIEGRKLHEASVHGQERRNCHGVDSGGIGGGGMRIDTAEAVDVSYPGFFQEMAGLGGW